PARGLSEGGSGSAIPFLVSHVECRVSAEVAGTQHATAAGWLWMRWTEALEAMPIDTRAQLINGLSIGFGWTALAARRVSRDASATAVASAVAAAHDVLGRSLRLLPTSL